MTERKRATHFALMDTAFAADRKFVRLAAKATPPIEYAAAVGVYWLILADCRRSKSPVVDWREYEEYGPQIDLLRSVGLIDDNGFPPDPFDKWAPVYKSPWDANRSTKPDAEVRNGTQVSATSVQFASPLITSPLLEGGPGETLPDEGDPVTMACRYLPNGGQWLGDKDYRVAWDDLVRRFGPEWVIEAIPQGYQECLSRGKVRPWDLKRLTEWVLAQRNRTEELAADKARAEAQALAEASHREQEREATPEQREQAALQRQAIGIAIKLGVKVPTEASEVRKFVMKHGSAA